MGKWFEWWENYERYMKSAEWKALRAEVMQRAGGRCERDGCTRVAVHAHHKTYDNLGHEPMGDLEALCIECHQAEHPQHEIGVGGKFYLGDGKKKKGRKAKAPHGKKRKRADRKPRDTPCPFCTKRFPDVVAVRVHAKAVHVYDLKNGTPWKRQRHKGAGKKPYTGVPVVL